MLRIVLTITKSSGQHLIYDEGEIGNISDLDAISSYEVLLDGRRVSTQLHEYPRWSEPVRGLLARCIAVAEPDSDLVPVPEDWAALRVDMGIQSGWQRRPTRIAMCRVTRETGSFNLGFVEGKLTGYIEGVQPRESYLDIWDLALHALNVSVWNSDSIPEVKPLVLPVYGEGSYIRTSDIPEPARSAFEWRQRMSGRPSIRRHWDAMWVWDWNDWLNGQR